MNQETWTLFQFHKVQLKALNEEQTDVIITVFQFHKVQLKVHELDAKIDQLYRFNSIRYN